MHRGMGRIKSISYSKVRFGLMLAKANAWGFCVCIAIFEQNVMFD